jgi:hypothetical protein
VYSARRQLGRYTEWFPLVNERFETVSALASELIADFAGDADVFTDPEA